MSRRATQILHLLRTGAIIWYPTGAKTAWILVENAPTQRVRVSLLHSLNAAGCIDYETSGSAEFPDTHVKLIV